uniref:Uncharacterized protein n=1 Tax=Oryza glumipatula TaxID=40148 RepID=A0A0D9Y9R8_9ORYZ
MDSDHHFSSATLETAARFHAVAIPLQLLPYVLLAVDHRQRLIAWTAGVDGGIGGREHGVNKGREVGGGRRGQPNDRSMDGSNRFQINQNPNPNPPHPPIGSPSPIPPLTAGLFPRPTPPLPSTFQRCRFPSPPLSHPEAPLPLPLSLTSRPHGAGKAGAAETAATAVPPPLPLPIGLDGRPSLSATAPSPPSRSGGALPTAVSTATTVSAASAGGSIGRGGDRGRIWQRRLPPPPLFSIPPVAVVASATAADRSGGGGDGQGDLTAPRGRIRWWRRHWWLPDLIGLSQTRTPIVGSTPDSRVARPRRHGRQTAHVREGSQAASARVADAGTGDDISLLLHLPFFLLSLLSLSPFLQIWGFRCQELLLPTRRRPPHLRACSESCAGTAGSGWRSSPPAGSGVSPVIQLRRPASPRPALALPSRVGGGVAALGGSGGVRGMARPGSSSGSSVMDWASPEEAKMQHGDGFSLLIYGAR